MATRKRACDCWRGGAANCKRCTPVGSHFQTNRIFAAANASAYANWDDLTLRGKVPNLEEAKFLELARDAEKNCPVSKVLKAEITLDAKLV